MTVAARRTASADPGELDELTLRRAQRGEAAAWRALVDRHQRPVFALISRMLGPGRRGQVEDLAQETFLQVVRSLERFSHDGPARLSTWILTIAARRTIDHLRRAELPVADAADVAGGEGGAAALHRAQVAAAIQRAIADLGPEYRAAFLLREYHGLDYGEIAAALRIDLGTVKSRLSRARAALRAALAEVHDE